MIAHTYVEHGAVVTIPCQCAVELHGTGLCHQIAAQGFPQKLTFPHSKSLPSPSVLPLCLWWDVSGFGARGTGPGDGWHSTEVTFCTFVFCCSQDALLKSLKCMKRPRSKLTLSQSCSCCKQQQDVNAKFLNF